MSINSATTSSLHACGSPLGTIRSTKLAPLHLVALGGMLDCVGGPCKHPCMRHGCIVAITTTFFSSTIAVAPSGTTTRTTTTASATTTTRRLHLEEHNIGLGKVGSEHGDLMFGGHQVGPGASDLLHSLDQLQGLKDFILGHLPLVKGGVGCNELVAKHFIVVAGKLIKE